MNTRLHHLLLATLVLLAHAVAQAAICRASPTGTGDGSSWAQATSLTAALANPACDEIRLQQGVYTSTDSPNRFNFSRDLRLLGGYEGTDAAPEQRGGAELTVLSGENSARVLFIDGTTGTPITTNTLIEGVTIANGANVSPGFGGGIRCYGLGNASECSPRLHRVHFANNQSNTSGGALSLVGDRGGNSSPELVDVSFTNNQASSNGGAVFNSADKAGTASPRLVNVTFSGNRSAYGGGAWFNNTGNGTSAPTIDHASFIDNQDQRAGGAVFYSVASAGGTGDIRVRNSVFWGNTGPKGAVSWSEGSGSSITVTDSLVQSGCTSAMGSTTGSSSTCSGLILTNDPQLSTLADNGGGTFTHLPANTSPLVDAVACLSGIASDQRGIARPQGTQCEIGAVELRVAADLDVTVSGMGTVSGGKDACGSTTSHCTATYAEADPLQITLTATPDAGQRFVGWSDHCSGTGVCTVSMDSARSVTATFAVIQATISLAGGSLPSGVASISPSLPLLADVGSSITLTIQTEAGFTLKSSAQRSTAIALKSASGCGGSLTDPQAGTYVIPSLPGDCTLNIVAAALPVAPAAVATPVPTLSDIAVTLLGLMLTALACARMRRA